MSEVSEPTTTRDQEDPLEVAVQTSKEAWRRLGLRLRSVTPGELVQLILVAGALADLGWILTRAVTPLVPFVVGLTLAYITAPIVEALDRVMPRALAVLLVIAGEIVFIMLIVVVLIVPLGREAGRIIDSLPNPEQLRQFFEDLAAHLRTLPEPTQVFIRDGLRQAANRVRDNLGTYFQQATDFALATVFRLIRTFSFILGLLILPTWLYSVMADQKRGIRALDAALPSWARADFWAAVRIVDRTLSASLRGLVLQGIAVGTATYLGIELLNRSGWVITEYELLAAVTAGLMELIPDIGPFLWVITAGAIGFSTSREVGLGLLGVYILGRWLVHRLLVSRIEQRVTRNVHPAVIVIATVALSEFGILWLFLTAPIVVIGWDLLRYVYGRVSSPPRPAGLLPDEALPATAEATCIPARQASRRRRGLRRPNAGTAGSVPPADLDMSST